LKHPSQFIAEIHIMIEVLLGKCSTLGDMKNAYKNLVGNTEGKKPFRCRILCGC